MDVECRCAELAPAVRLELARKLHGVAEGARGEPMLYELASAAPGLLEDTLSNPTPPAALRQTLSANELPTMPESESAAGTQKPASAAMANGRAHRGGPRRQAHVDVHAESRHLKVNTALSVPCPWI